MGLPGRPRRHEGQVEQLSWSVVIYRTNDEGWCAHDMTHDKIYRGETPRVALRALCNAVERKAKKSG